MSLLSYAAAGAAAPHHKRGHRATGAQVKRGSQSPPGGEAIPVAPESTAAEPVPAAAPSEPEVAPRASPVVDDTVDGDETVRPPAPAPRPPRALAARPGDADGSEEAVLGRREAARLAAGRFEVLVMAGLAVGRRDFTYSDPIGDLPQPYRLAAAPLAVMALEAYPWASSEVPVVRDLGLRGHFSRAFALGSSTSTGVPIDTAWTRFGGELRQRVLVPGARRLELGLDAGVDASYFDLRTSGGVGALVPASRMVSLRFGLDGRLILARRLSLSLGGAYLASLSHGQIYDHFRDPRVAGVDGDFGLAIRLTAAVELRLDGRYTRYFSSFNPNVGDPAVAGGALDQQFQLGVGIRHAH